MNIFTSIPWDHFSIFALYLQFCPGGQQVDPRADYGVIIVDTSTPKKGLLEVFLEWRPRNPPA